MVKRIWTPSWVLFSGGWCFLLLAAFYAVDRRARPGGAWAFPLVVIGMNSIAAYCLSHLIDGFITQSLQDPPRPGRLPRPRARPTSRSLQGAAVLLVLWLILFWMYRRRLFLRI